MGVAVQASWSALAEGLDPVPDGVRIVVQGLGNVLLGPPLAQQPERVPALALARPRRRIHPLPDLAHIQVPRLEQAHGVHRGLLLRRPASRRRFAPRVYPYRAWRFQLAITLGDKRAVS